MDSRNTSDTATIKAREAEGIGFMLLGAVFLINGNSSRIAAQNALNKAIDYFNRDTGRTAVETTMSPGYIGLSVSKKF